MKKIFNLLAVLLTLATLTGCSIKNDAYKNKYAQMFIQSMEEIKEGLPEDAEFDYEVCNTLDNKAKASMELTYNGHTLEMIFTFDKCWDQLEETELNLEGDEQELMDTVLTVKIDGVKYTDAEAVEALVDVYFND